MPDELRSLKTLCAKRSRANCSAARWSAASTMRAQAQYGASLNRDLLQQLAALNRKCATACRMREP